MTQSTRSTRRTFLKGGALLAAPLAAGQAATVVMAEAPDRIGRLEDAAALRDLHDNWLRQINSAGGDPRLDASVRRITADHAGAADRIEMAADARSAVGHFEHAVEFETALPADSTLAQMAHVQGHGVVRRTERRLVRIEYAKVRGSWTVGRVTLAPCRAP